MIEMVISKEIVDIRYIGTEETVRATTEDKGIRFDVLLKDKTKYINIEMQTIYKKEIPLRSRYYHSSLDVRQLRPGMEYQELKENYVIFLCLTDMFDRGLPVYTFHTICEEDKTLNLEDKRTTIFINASGRGTNEELNGFNEYLQTGRPTTSLTKEIEEAVKDIKEDDTIRGEYMTYREHLEESKEEGFKEGSKATKISNCIGFLKEHISVSIIARAIGITEEEVLQIAKENNIPIHN